MFDAGPLAFPGPVVFYAGYLSDVRIEYVTVIHVSGAAKVLTVNAMLDGTAIGTGANLNDNTLYYVYLAPTADAHLYSVNRTPYAGDESKFAQSYGNLTITPGAVDIDNVRLIVRYVQL